MAWLGTPNSRVLGGAVRGFATTIKPRGHAGGGPHLLDYVVITGSSGSFVAVSASKRAVGPSHVPHCASRAAVGL